jgi:Trypsin
VRRARAVACLLALTVASGCNGDDTADSVDIRCPGVETQALVGGGSRATFLGLSEEQENAVVAIQPLEPGDGPMLCSGTLVAPNQVLTAKHCGDSQRMIGARVTVGADLRASSAHLSVIAATEHPALDLIMLTLDAVASGAHVMTIATAEEFGPSDGELVQLAGWGLTTMHAVGERNFAVEEIAHSDSEAIVVDGRGASGGCLGDSGGPLLVRDVHGRPHVIGVLSAGSASCRGVDLYLPLRAAQAWLADVLESSTENTAGGMAEACDSIDAIGRCFGNNALWCRDGSLSAHGCEHCGWDRSAAGLRCTASDDDPCQGVDTLGRCEGDSVVICDQGRVLRQRCDACSVCARSSVTGRAMCRAADGD